MNFLQFMMANRQQVLDLTLEHMTLAGVATLLAALVVPTACLANMTFAGVNFTAGSTPVPLRPSFCGLPDAL